MANNQNVAMNKRVFSANRASSLNQSNNAVGHPISMQQRRRQQAVLIKKDVNYQGIGNKTALSHGSASSAHINYDPVHHGMTSSQNYPRQKHSNGNAQHPNQKYTDDDGFMRGARIAEKIQEYYHSNSNIMTNPNTNHNSNFVN